MSEAKRTGHSGARVRAWLAVALAAVAVALVGLATYPPLWQTDYIAAPDEKFFDSVSSLVNINLAGVRELCMLPGIGESKAAAIITWREEHGAFTDVEGLLDVPGIGEKTLDGLRDQVCV